MSKLTVSEQLAVEAQIRGWFKDDLESETYFGYFGRCDVEGAARSLAQRIADELVELKEG